MEKKGLFDKIFSRLKNSINISEKNFQLILYIVIIVLVNVAGVTFNLRFDITRDNTYSLSEKSRDVVSNLKENLKVKVFFSEDLPAEHESVYRYLKDLLDEYDYYGNRYFSYEIVDAESLEKEAADYGIKSVTSREFSDDQVKMRRSFMGLALQHADIIEKIETVADSAGLEYEITSLIEKMTGKIDGLLSLKKNLELNLFMDSRMKDLPIDGIDKLEKSLVDAVAKSNLRNYNRISFRFVDSSKDNKTANTAKLYGLTQINWPAMKTKTGKRLKSGKSVFGLVLSNGEKFKVIDLRIGRALFGNNVVTGLNDIETKINNAVGELLNSSQKIGYITGHGIKNINDMRTREGAGFFKEILSDLYSVTEIDLSKNEIQDSISTIIINGPQEAFKESELYKIDQFLMAGGSALFFVDSFKEMQMPNQNPMMRQQQPIIIPLNTGIENMLKHYGVTVNKDVVLDKNCTKVNLGNMIKEYPLIPVITESSLDRVNIITRYLKGVAFKKAASLTCDEKKLEKAGITVTDLISSSEESWLMKGRINYNPFFMNADKKENLKSYKLSVLLSGKFESMFKGKPVPSEARVKQGAIRSENRLDSTVNSGKSRIIVTGSSDITKSGFILESRKIFGRGRRGGASPNEHLLHSMVDYLAGNHFVPEMKSKSLDYNPLEKTEDSTRFVLKTLNIAGVPILILLMGFFTWRMRLRRRENLKKEFAGVNSNEQKNIN